MVGGLYGRGFAPSIATARRPPLMAGRPFSTRFRDPVKFPRHRIADVKSR
jgi:hypothetical protein